MQGYIKVVKRERGSQRSSHLVSAGVVRRLTIEKLNGPLTWFLLYNSARRGKKTAANERVYSKKIS